MLHPNTKRIALAIIVVAILSLRIHSHPPQNTTETLEVANLVKDEANLLDQEQTDWIAQYHAAILKAYDIDLRVKTTGTKDDINLNAAQLFTDWRVGDLSHTGRGILLLVNPTSNQVRLEVGRSLEGIYTDAFVAYIEKRQMVPFFQANRVADGVLATTEMIADRAKQAIAGEEFDPTTLTKLEASTGAGAVTDAQIGEGYQRPEITDGDDSTTQTDSPLSVVASYLEAMEAGNASPDLNIYSKATKHMMANWVVTPAQMKNMVQAYRNCTVTDEKTSGNHAVVRYDVSKRECAPYFLEQEDGAWKLNLTMMSSAIRFNHKNEWHFTNGIPTEYTFAFTDWQFDGNGFPFLRR